MCLRNIKNHLNIIMGGCAFLLKYFLGIVAVFIAPTETEESSGNEKDVTQESGDNENNECDSKQDSIVVTQDPHKNVITDKNKNIVHNPDEATTNEQNIIKQSNNKETANENNEENIDDPNTALKTNKKNENNNDYSGIEVINEESNNLTNTSKHNMETDDENENTTNSVNGETIRNDTSSSPHIRIIIAVPNEESTYDDAASRFTSSINRDVVQQEILSNVGDSSHDDTEYIPLGNMKPTKKETNTDETEESSNSKFEDAASQLTVNNHGATEQSSEIHRNENATADQIDKNLCNVESLNSRVDDMNVLLQPPEIPSNVQDSSHGDTVYVPCAKKPIATEINRGETEETSNLKFGDAVSQLNSSDVHDITQEPSEIHDDSYRIPMKSTQTDANKGNVKDKIRDYCKGTKRSTSAKNKMYGSVPRQSSTLIDETNYNESNENSLKTNRKVAVSIGDDTAKKLGDIKNANFELSDIIVERDCLILSFEKSPKSIRKVCNRLINVLRLKNSSASKERLVKNSKN